MLSVVYISYSRPEIWCGSILGLLSQSVFHNGPFEIITSIDKADPSLGLYKQYYSQVEKVFKDRFGKNASLELVINDTDGLVKAKNNAVDRCQYEFVMMLDDDLFMEEDYILELLKDLKASKELVAASGYIVSSVPAISHTQPSDLLDEAPASEEKLQTLVLDKDGAEWRSVFGKKEQVMDWSKVNKSLDVNARYHMDYFVNSYMFKKSMWEVIDGYNEDLNSKTSAHEEVDFTFRLGKLGGLLFNPFVRMWHITVGSGGIYKGKNWGESRGILEQEYSDSLKPFLDSISQGIS